MLLAPSNMPVSRKGIFARNISSNLAGYLVNAAVMFLLTPFVLQELGDGPYGIWSVLIATTGSYGIFDLGIRSAAGLYLTRYSAQDDAEGVNRSFSTAFVLLSGLAVIGLLATLGLASQLPEFLGSRSSGEIDPGAVGRDAQAAFLVIGASVSLCLPLALFQAVTYAKERMDLSNGLGILERLLIAGLSVWSLQADYGLFGLSCVVGGVQLVIAAARVLVARRLMPGLRVSPGLFSSGAVRELLSYGVYNSLVNAADRVVLAAGAVIALVAIDEYAVTYYENGAKLIPIYTQLVLAVTWTITPYATKLDAQGDRAQLRRLLVEGTRGSTFLAAVIGGGLIFVGEPFLGVWLGPKYIEGGEFVSSGWILALLAIGSLARSASSCGRQVLFATRRVRRLAAMSAVDVVCTLGLSVALVGPAGIEGLAWATMAPAWVIYFGWQTVSVCRCVGLPVVQLVRAQLTSILPTLAVMFAFDFFVRRWLPGDNWGEVLVRSAVMFAAAMLVGYSIVRARIADLRGGGAATER